MVENSIKQTARGADKMSAPRTYFVDIMSAFALAKFNVIIVCILKSQKNIDLYVLTLYNNSVFNYFIIDRTGYEVQNIFKEPFNRD